MFLGEINLYFGRMLRKRQMIVWVVCCLMATCAMGQVGVTVFGPGEVVGKLEQSEINEVSGLTASVANGRHFWTHNDSGDKARIFLIDDSARYKATYYLQGVTAHDWEEIGMMERGGRQYVIVGDIGDNRGQRPYVAMHVIEEPVANVGVPSVDTIPTEQIRTFILRYEDGPRDAESFFFDPIDQQLYVISKRELKVGVYSTALPENPVDTLILRKVGGLPQTFMTSAAISPDGTEVLMKNLLNVFYWRRKAGESVPDMLSRPALKLPYQPEPQGEALAFARDGTGYYTLSEAVLGMTPFLYLYQRMNGVRY